MIRLNVLIYMDMIVIPHFIINVPSQRAQGLSQSDLCGQELPQTRTVDGRSRNTHQTSCIHETMVITRLQSHQTASPYLQNTQNRSLAITGSLHIKGRQQYT